MIIPGIIASSMVGAVGDYESISTVTVGSGGSSSITFSSIPSTYAHLQLRGISRSTGSATYGTNDVILLRLNSDSGTNYSSHYVVGGDGTGGTAVFAGAAAGQTYFNMGWNASNSSASNVFSASVTDLLDYSSTNKYKTLRMLEGYETNSSSNFGYNCLWFGSGAWYNTTAISSITLTYSGSNFAQYSSFALYGIKG